MYLFIFDYLYLLLCYLPANFFENVKIARKGTPLEYSIVLFFPHSNKELSSIVKYRRMCLVLKGGTIQVIYLVIL